MDGTNVARAGSEERIEFQAVLLDSVREAVIATDLQGTIVFWNRFAEELYGWSRQEAIGRNIVYVTPAPDMERRASEILSRLAAGETWSGEFLLRRRDGSRFWAHVANAPMSNANGTLVGIVGLSRDITGELAARQILKRRLVARDRKIAALRERVGSLASELAKSETDEGRRIAARVADIVADAAAIEAKP